MPPSASLERTQLPPLPSDHPNYCPPSPLRASPVRTANPNRLSYDASDASCSRLTPNKAPPGSDMVLVVEEVTGGMMPSGQRQWGARYAFCPPLGWDTSL